MGFTCGIVGFPNAGKTTLFDAMTHSNAEIAPYPFSTIEPHTGVMPIPDDRLNKIAEIYKPKKTTSTVVEVADIAGLVKGSSEGAGLGNQFLSHIRNVDAIFHVVRCFTDPNVAHPAGKIDPLDDIATVDTELCLKDLETLGKRIEKSRKLAKAGDKKSAELTALYEKASDALNQRTPLRNFSLSEDETNHLNEFQMLTMKPVLYCCNVNEEDLPEGGPPAQKVKAHAEKEGAKFAVISAKVEAELLELPESEKKEYFESYHIKESEVIRLAREGCKLLDLITFFTVNPEEARAWTLKAGRVAYDAAGKVHSDFQKGFIRAEVMKFDDLVKYGSQEEVKHHGHFRIEGKDHVIHDGDIVYIRHHA